MKDNFKYYIDYFSVEFLNLDSNRPWLSFDSRGVVVSSLERLKSKFKLDIPLKEEYFYHPCEIAQVVCAYYDFYKDTGSEEYR